MKKIFLFLFLFISFNGIAQKPLFKFTQKFTKQDSLRGSITPQRAWWDVKKYDLAIQVFPKTKTLSGSNTISFEVLKPQQQMQIDLQQPMQITKITHGDKTLNFKREGNVFWVDFNEKLPLHSNQKITLYFSGKPREAKHAPWDGGISWEKDKNNTDFIASSNQGIGASIWWPNKDIDSDEPDNGARISVTVPQHLTNVSNGRLVAVKEHLPEQTKTFVWEVVNPINNYSICFNIGDYTHFSEKYNGEKGILDCDYWVLKHHLKKAKKQFKQAPKMLKAFEYWFGPYPFYEDSYKLVEAPYLGMEHQSCITYGNHYQNGYLGSDLSGTGVGLLFDFIIIHESGHEWFANSITNKDVADMWIHESFTCYSESLYLDYHFGTQKANTYVQGIRKNIKNDKPIIGQYGVNNSGSGDMYYKGANMLHTLRQMINNDDKWRTILRGLNTTFYHQQVTTQQIENYISEQSGLDLKGFFDQYLRTNQIPYLKIKKRRKKIQYHFKKGVQNLKMPVKIHLNNKVVWLPVSNRKKTYKSNERIKTIKIDPNFYLLSNKK